MKSLKAVLVIVCLLGDRQGNAEPSQSLVDVRESLIQITQKLQAYEGALSQNEKELKLLRKQEREVFTYIAKQQHILASALQGIKHFREYSPVLIALSSVSLDDLVHSFLVLQSCTPKLEKQNRFILEAVKKVAELRHQIKKKEEAYANLKALYYESLKTQAYLFENKFEKYFLPKTPEVQKLQERAEELKSASLEEVLAKLESLSSPSEDKKVTDLKLIGVAVGKSLQACKGISCSNTAESNLAIQILPRAEAQIVSPCNATVIYIGAHSERGQFIVLKRDEYFLILSGLGSVSCRVGEDLLEGEPIGCASSSTTVNTSANEANEARKGFKSAEKIIYFQLRKGTKFIDSTPYLRTPPNDKKV